MKAHLSCEGRFFVIGIDGSRRDTWSHTIKERNGDTYVDGVKCSISESHFRCSNTYLVITINRVDLTSMEVNKEVNAFKTGQCRIVKRKL